MMMMMMAFSVLLYLELNQIRMMMEIRNKIDYTYSIVGFFTLLTLLEHGYSHKTPNNDGKRLSKDRPEIFYDTRMIPERVVKNIYIYKSTKNLFAFLKETADSRLSITVTPCASDINWRVIFKRLHSNSQFESAGTPISQSLALQNFSGDASNTYQEKEGRKGLYIVELEAITSETYARVYVTTTPDIDNIFPLPPADNHLNTTMKTAKDVSVAWKPSSSSTNKIKYCVSFSRKRQFYTNCGVLAHFHGDAKPTLPPHTGFGFKEEKKKRLLRKSAKPIRSAPKGHIFYDCVGSKLSYTFKKGKPGRKYFINVFAINSTSNMSISYAGVQVKLKRNKKKRFVVKENKVQTLVIKRRKIPKLYFSLSRNVKALNLFLQACGDVMKIRVTKSKQKTKVVRSSITFFRKLVLKDLEAGNYQIRVSRDKKNHGLQQSLTLLLQDSSSHIDVPRLPHNAKVTVLSNSTLCNQVTISWNATEKNQRYCVYKSKIPKIIPEIRANRKVQPQCVAVASRKKFAKLFCKVANKQKVFTETIDKLTPGTSYMVSVYVGLREREMFAYQSVFVTTKSYC
ncbi:protein NDNF isoform X1 [Octopus bimaculoides]|uniref:protein NDNF isoform X1 n=3 Tax=Octopus bimaculoides TaxID=37653 RepID=UPI0022DFE400|nr:protein NDNF isoform X1 [Octopus bimaculoides]XP_052834431.1 protein NDNF isoform X1 [Octopus bimaculoides]XP_052834432.1 protein NDNF isoform X1 [Octopus bimaculoides]